LIITYPSIKPRDDATSGLLALDSHPSARWTLSGIIKRLSTSSRFGKGIEDAGKGINRYKYSTKEANMKRFPSPKWLIPLIILAVVIAAAPACKGKRGAEALDELTGEIDIERSISQEEAHYDQAKPAAKSKAEGLGAGYDDRTALPAAPPADALDLPSTRMIIKTAALSVRVKNVDEAYDRAIVLVEAGGGYILSGTISEAEGASANITIKVHPRRFTSLISKLEELGTVEYKNISGEDVTEEYFDLQAELATQLALKDRLFDLLKKAKNVAEAIQVEQELQRVDYNVNRIKGRMKYLEQMVAESTITLSMYSESYTPRTPFVNWDRIGQGFRTAGQILVYLFFGLLQVLIVLIPIAVIVLLIVWLVIRIVRKRKEKKAKG